MNIAPGRASTPEPPGLDEVIFTEVKSTDKASDENFVAPKGRSAVYASKEEYHYSQLNTLVPEDFNLIDFNFKDLKPNKTTMEEAVKTDHTFDVPVETNEESVVNTDTAPVLEAAAVVATVSAWSTVNEEYYAPPIILPAPVIVQEPLLKVSEARKSLEVKEAAFMEASKPAPIIVAAVPVSKIEAVNDKENIKPDTIKQEATVVAPAIIYNEPVAKEVFKNETKETNTVPLIVAPRSTGKAENVAEEMSAPPPLPTNNAHLVSLRDSLKPSMLPVKPISGAPSTEPEPTKPLIETTTAIALTAPSVTSPLSKNETTSEELAKLKNEFEIQAVALEKENKEKNVALKQEIESQKLALEEEFKNHKLALEREMENHKQALEREINTKKALEAQIQAILSKSNAQEETLKYKNESLDQLNSDYLKTNNDLTSARNEKTKLEAALAKAEEELAATSETNAKAFLEKSDEVSALKDKLAEFAAIIGQKNKQIASLEHQLDETKRANLQTALQNVHQYEKIEDDLVAMVEIEILRMQDTIDEQREYNSKLQVEVDSEYAFWKRKLEESAKGD